MDHGYLLIADVLGFSKIVENSAGQDLEWHVDSWLELVAEATQKAGLKEEPQLISDTVFACAGPSPGGLQSLVRFARHLLEGGIEDSLLLRGAITFGPYRWGRLTYGRAVIAAHQLEMRQDWIGISCNDIPEGEATWGPEGLVCYPPPFKDGAIQLHPVVVWDVPSSRNLQRASMGDPLIKAGEVLQWPWLRRLRHTNDFGTYLKTLPKDDIEKWKMFQGSTW
jgi:hypothetical protein